MKTNSSFAGRNNELAYLNKLFKANQSQLVVLYGRRRVGKSTLLEKFCRGKRHLYFTGRKGEAEHVLKGRLLKQMAHELSNPLLEKLTLHDWSEIFDLLPQTKQKFIIVLDEFQWMCPHRSVLISALQEYWDKKWQHNKKIFLVLCGSIISFMEKSVLSEKSPLHGRRNASFELEPLPPHEARLFFTRRSDIETCQLLMLWGGVPSYLKLIEQKDSVAQNINRLALTRDSYFTKEIQFILREQLKSYDRYALLLELLAQQPLSREELAKAMNINNSGTLDLYLKSLQSLHLIKMLTPITLPNMAKTRRYVIWDEFLRFYFFYISQNKEQIQLNHDDWLFDKIVAPKWDLYCGHAFELFCKKNIAMIIKKLNIKSVFKRSGTYWHRGNARQKGVEIDLVIERTDKVTHLIECKWSHAKIGTSVLNEITDKKSNYPNPLGHTLKTALITPIGVTKDVIKTGIVEDVIILKDLMNAL